MLFGAPDAIWALWFAILDKRRSRGTSNNCLPVRDVNGVSYTLYSFAISHDAIHESPYVDGMLYIASRDPFSEREDLVHWGSTVPVEPLLRFPVSPGDFPYLEYVKGVDWAVMKRRFESDPDIGGRLDDREVFPHAPEIPEALRGDQVDRPTREVVSG